MIGWATAAASTEPLSSVEMQEGEYIADVRRHTKTMLFAVFLQEYSHRLLVVIPHLLAFQCHLYHCHHHHLQGYHHGLLHRSPCCARGHSWSNCRGEKRHGWSKQIDDLLRSGRRPVQAKDLAKLLGRLNNASYIIPYARHFTGRLYKAQTRAEAKGAIILSGPQLEPL